METSQSVTTLSLFHPALAAQADDMALNSIMILDQTVSNLHHFSWNQNLVLLGQTGN